MSVCRGYMAPEYALWGYLTYKADVYSFGVVVLEIVSGKNNNNYMPSNTYVCLLDWVLRNFLPPSFCCTSVFNIPYFASTKASLSIGMLPLNTSNLFIIIIFFVWKFSTVEVYSYYRPVTCNKVEALMRLLIRG